MTAWTCVVPDGTFRSFACRTFRSAPVWWRCPGTGCSLRRAHVRFPYDFRAFHGTFLHPSFFIVRLSFVREGFVACLTFPGSPVARATTTRVSVWPLFFCVASIHPRFSLVFHPLLVVQIPRVVRTRACVLAAVAIASVLCGWWFTGDRTGMEPPCIRGLTERGVHFPWWGG